LPFETQQKATQFLAAANAIDTIAIELLSLTPNEARPGELEARLKHLGGQLRHLSADLAENIQAGRTRHLGMRDALAASERHFRTVAENLPHHLARHDADARLVYANPKLEAFLGHSVADIAGKRPTEIAPGEGLEAYERMVLETARTGRPHAQELKFVADDGQQVVHEIHFVAERGDGEVASVLTIGYDITERTAAELAYKKALNLAEGVIAAIPDVLFEVDSAGRYLTVWTKSPDSLARPADELIGKTVADVLPPQQAAAAMAAIAEANEKGVTHGHVIEIDLPDGGRRCFEHSLAKKAGDTSAADSFLVLSRDITPRREVEQALQETHANLLGVLQTIPDMVWLKDINGVFLLCNHRVEQLFSKPASEIIGKTDYDLHDKALADFVVQKDREAIEARRICINEEWILDETTGEPVLFETRKVPVFDADGNVTGVLGVARDITECHRAQETLAAREREFRTLAENLPMSIARYDCTGKQIYANPQFAGDPDLLACDESVRIAAERGTRAPAPAEQLQEAVMNVMTTGVPTELELCLARDGEPAWYTVRIAPEFGPGAEVVSALTIRSDITRHKRMEQALRALVSRRDTDLEKERRRIARELHDELGQQMVGLRMNLNLLGIQFGDEVPRIREATRRMLAQLDTTIQNTRDVSSSLRPPVLDMGLIPALEWLAAAFQQHTGLRCDLSMPCAEVDMTEEQRVTIFRVAQESLTNAAKHAMANTIEIAFRRDAGCFVLEVKDNGSGFDPHSRRNPNTFGLAGMRERVMAVGGDLVVESGAGRGTTVRARIPAASGTSDST